MFNADHIDQADFRRTLGNFCTGVVVVAGYDEQGPVGFTAQSLVSLSLSPALIGISPAKSSSSWQRIRRTGKFSINILTDRQKALAEKFSRSAIDRFGAVSWHLQPDEMPIIDGILAYISCEIESEHSTGDHDLVVGRVRQLQVLDPNARPLLFFRGALGNVMEGQLLA